MLSWGVTFDHDPVAINAFSTATVRVTITVPAGTDRGTYNITLSGLSSVNGSVVNNTVLTESVEEVRHSVELTPVSASQQAKPGELARWSITIRNTGNVADMFELTVLGLGSGYVTALFQDTAEVTGVQLTAGEQVTVLLEVTVPTVFATAPATTTLPFDLKATSAAVATASASTRLTLQLKGILDLSLEVSTSTNAPKAGGHVVFTLSVTNTGPDDAAGVVVLAYFGQDRPVRKTVGDIKSQETSADAKVDWWPSKEGSTTVRIVLNPTGEDFTLFELDRTNNEWNRTYQVASAASTGIWLEPIFWVVIIVLVVVILLVYALWSRGGRGREEEPLEVSGEEAGAGEVADAELGEGPEGDGPGDEAEPVPAPPPDPPMRPVAGAKGGQAPRGARTAPAGRPKGGGSGSEEELKGSLSGGRM
jgi:hypothetical protein